MVSAVSRALPFDLLLIALGASPLAACSGRQTAPQMPNLMAKARPSRCCFAAVDRWPGCAASMKANSAFMKLRSIALRRLKSPDERAAGANGFHIRNSNEINGAWPRRRITLPPRKLARYRLRRRFRDRHGSPAAAIANAAAPKKQTRNQGAGTAGYCLPAPVWRSTVG